MDAETLKGIWGIDDDEKINAAIKAFDEETEGLRKTKNLLREQVKDFEKKLKAYEGIAPEEIASMKEELEELREAAESSDGEGQQRKITAEERKAIEERATRKLQEQLEGLQTRLTDVTQRYHGTLIDRELREAIQKVGFKAEAQDLIYKAFRNEAKVEEIDGELVVQLKNKDGLNLSPEEFLTDWSKSDSAKEFIKPPENTGGGARGGNSPSTKKPEEYTERERVELYKKDPDRFRELFGGN